MVLIKCPECDNEISDTATQLIHCGYKLIKDESNNDKGIIILRKNRSASYASSIVSLILAIAFFLFGLRCFITSLIPSFIFTWIKKWGNTKIFQVY
jgi:hypothetical protein